LYRIGFIIVITLAVALGTVIGTLNSDTVSVDLLWVQLEWPLGLLILSILFVGLLLGLGLAWFFGIVPLRVRLRKARTKEQSVTSGTLKT
jgi:uncharacterized integral membrane protein